MSNSTQILICAILDPITNAELAELSEELLSLDVNNAMSFIEINLQDSTSSGGPDNAPEP